MQAEEKARLAARKLSSFFAREVPFCACKRQDRVISVVGTRAELGLCHEQVPLLAKTSAPTKAITDSNYRTPWSHRQDLPKTRTG